MKTNQMEAAIRSLLNGSDYVSGGHFAKHGLVWEAEKGTEGHAILTVFLARRSNRQFCVYAGPTASCENDRDSFTAAVSQTLNCPASLSEVMSALAVI